MFHCVLGSPFTPRCIAAYLLEQRPAYRVGTERLWPSVCLSLSLSLCVCVCVCACVFVCALVWKIEINGRMPCGSRLAWGRRVECVCARCAMIVVVVLVIDGWLMELVASEVTTREIERA